ncbi:MAG: hypothetical protein WEC34_08315 [Acidimicrobiia bacterium]
MRVVYAVPVRHIEQLVDGTLGAFGIETQLFAVPLPAPMISPLVVALAVPHAEAHDGVKHPLSIKVLGPDLSEVAPALETEIGIAPGENTPEGWECRVVTALAARWEATEYGTYSVEISASDGSISVPYIVSEPQA